MAHISGKNASSDISIGGSVLKVKSWSADLEQTEIDTTDKGDNGWYTPAAGIKKLSGSFEADMDTAVHATGTFPFPFSDSTASFSLAMGDGTNDGGSFGGTCMVFKCSFTSPVDGVIGISGDFASKGEVTYTAGA